MDLGAYAQINNLSQIMKENNIDVPRLRGLRLMKNEQPLTKEEIKEDALSIGLEECAMLCESKFIIDAGCYMCSSSTTKLKEKYLIMDNFTPVGVKWDKIHGKKRKSFKYVLKRSFKRVTRSIETFNKYCGRDDVLYIHARIGGGNWPYYGKYVKDQPWFIERIDDPYDNTYCDIYAKIK